jgi:hypothetical protein
LLKQPISVPIRAEAAQASIGRIELDRVRASSDARTEFENNALMARVNSASEPSVFLRIAAADLDQSCPKINQAGQRFSNETPSMAAERESAHSRVYFQYRNKFSVVLNYQSSRGRRRFEQ